MPNVAPEEFLALDPADTDKILGLKAIQYDIVCNGIELSSGAIRNHRPDVMKKAFAIAGYGEDVLEQKFGGMLRALSYGAPPHGGIAPGIDRIVMLLVRRGEPARGRALPDEPARRGPADGRALGGLAEAAARAAHPAQSAGEGRVTRSSAPERGAINAGMGLPLCGSPMRCGSGDAVLVMTQRRA